MNTHYLVSVVWHHHHSQKCKDPRLTYPFPDPNSWIWQLPNDCVRDCAVRAAAAAGCDLYVGFSVSSMYFHIDIPLTAMMQNAYAILLSWMNGPNAFMITAVMTTSFTSKIFTLESATVGTSWIGVLMYFSRSHRYHHPLKDRLNRHLELYIGKRVIQEIVCIIGRAPHLPQIQRHYHIELPPFSVRPSRLSHGCGPSAQL